MPQGGFAVTISARDNVSAALSKINRGVSDLGKASKAASEQAAGGSQQALDSFGKFGEHVKRTGGLIGGFGREAWQTFGEIGRRAGDTARRVTEILTPLRALGAAASIGGIGALTDKFAHAGAGILRTAQTIGLSARELQRLQGAGEYAGIGADEMAGALGSLNRQVHDAAYGLAGSDGLIYYANRAGIALRNSDGSIRNSAEVFGDLADAIAKLSDPDSQARLADAFGVREALPLLRQGRAGMMGLADSAERAGGVLSGPALEKAHELEKSYVRLGQTARGAAYLIAATLEPTVKRLADWLTKDENREWLGSKIEGFITYLQGVDLSKIETIIDKLGILAKRLGLTDEGNSSGIAGTVAGAGLGAWLGKFFGPTGALVGGAIGGFFGSGGKPSDIRIGRAGVAPFAGSGAAADPRGMGAAIRAAADPRGMGAAIRAAATKYGHDPDVAMRVAGAGGLGTFSGDKVPHGVPFTSIRARAASPTSFSATPGSTRATRRTSRQRSTGR